MRTRRLSWLMVLAATGCGGIPDSELAIINAGGDASTTHETATPDAAADFGAPLDLGAATDLGSVIDAGADVPIVVDAPPPFDAKPPPPDVTAGVPCPEPGAVMFGGHCYFAIDPSGWNDAQSSCQATTPPAHLVTITSDAEQAAVQNVMSGTQRWIGMSRDDSDPATPASYVWVTGEPATYQNWNTDPTDVEPNGTGDCVRLLENGVWADYYCDDAYPSICERE